MGQFPRLTTAEVGALMRDMQPQLDNLIAQAAECSRTAARATDKAKQELFARLADHFTMLASEVEKAIAKMPPKE
jgi:hypothetical protein